MSWLLPFWTVIFGFGSFFLLRLVRQVLRRKRILRHMPGLKETFMVGHGLLFLNKKPVDIFKTLRNGSKELGSRVWKVFLLHECNIMISDPKLCEEIMTSPTLINKSTEYSMLKNWLGDGLLLSTGKKWQSRRKVITPAFHFNILEQFAEIFDRNSNILVDILKKMHPSKQPIDIYPLVNLAALDIICETSMSAVIDAQRNSESEYVKAVKERIFDILLRNNVTYPFSKIAQREKAALKVLHNFTIGVIERRRKDLLSEKANEELSTSDNFGVKHKMALLDVLLQSTVDGMPLTNAEILEEVDTFMFEGHDTTTSGITFALYCIAQKPEVQRKILKEIHEVIGNDKSTPVTVNMLNKLQYLEMAIKEALRLYPSVPLIGRGIDQDTVINGVKIPGGTNLILGIFIMQRDPELYHDPDEFIPERFAEAQEGIQNFSYVPFSAGPRNCIGQKFAMYELKSIVSKILRNFIISVDPSYEGPVLIAEVVLKPENGMLLNLEPR